MTIILTKSIRVAGAPVAAGTTVTYSADLEADLVQRGHATYAAGSPSFSGREVPVMASTSSSGGVPKIMAGDVDVTGQISAVEYADPYFSARPPSLVPINTIRMKSYCQIGSHHYGIATDAAGVYRMLESDAAPEKIYTFPAGSVVYSLYYELSVLFAVVAAADGKYTLYRSTDSGMSFVESVKIGIGADGQHYAGSAPFVRGIASGRLKNGQEVVICTTYNVDMVTASVAEKDRRYAIISYDKGVSWSVLWELNVGVKNTRHFHGVQIDTDGRVIVMLGDDDTENATVVAQDILTWPFPNNVTPAQLKTYPGFYVATGAQHHRAVDCMIVTDSDGSKKLLTYSDAASDAVGGIWVRDYPTLENATRVAHPNFGQQHDGWLLARTPDGTIYACDACLSGPNMYFNVTGSSDGGLHWFAVGKYYLPGNGSTLQFRVTHEGNLAICSNAGAGPTVAMCTHIYRQGPKVLDDDIESILAPVIYVRPNGDDANDGGSPLKALQSLRIAMAGGKAVPRCRIVLQGALHSCQRISTFAPRGSYQTADTRIYFHVSGDGADKTAQVITGVGGTQGPTTQEWTARLDGLKIYRETAAADLFLVDAATQTGAVKWIVTDAVIGDPENLAGYNVYLQTATFQARRSVFYSHQTDPLKYQIFAQQAGVADVKACLFVGGVISQKGAADLSIQHCTADKFLGYKIDAAATVAPKLRNNNFGEGVYVASVVNSSSLDLEATVTGNYFPIAGANIPAQTIPASSAALIGTGYKPRPGSSLFATSATGVLHDLYGKPFRAKPSVGAVQG